MREPTTLESLPIRELVKLLIGDGTQLIKRQVRLAEIESRRQLRKGRTSVTLLAVGAALAYAGVVVLLIAAALAIGSALGEQPWLGAVLVGGALLLGASAVGAFGYSKRVKKPLARTRANLSQELTWAKTLRT